VDARVDHVHDDREIDLAGAGEFDIRFEMLERNCDRLKTKRIDFDDARLLAVRAAEEGAIPSCDILSVLNEYRRPKYEEFADPTMWSLFNSFTEVAKKYGPERADTCHRTISNMFLLSGGEQ
jgi:hypothetical protein